MRTYASPRPGYCTSCEGIITGRPVTRMEQAYCCIGCARGELCVCTYEADMAADGVDGLGLLSSVPQAAPIEAAREAEVAPTVMAPVRDGRVVVEREPELVA